jgi:hypothetical protein
MTTRNLFLFGVILMGLVVLISAGFGILVPINNVVLDDGKAIAKFTSPLSFSSYLIGDQESDGNEFTGLTSGLLFWISSLPIIFRLTTRLINRRVSLRPRLQGLFEWFTQVNNKYLMQFHTYLSILALALAVVHFIFSSCPLNPLPEWGLIMAGILVVTGLIVKLRIAPKLKNRIYQFHTSLVVTGILLSVLLAGHVLMD